jgi:membrane peptidoglycan carboxypeptidase
VKGAQDWDLNNRIAIGSAQVSPVNMANAYATFADNGVYHKNHVIAEILDNHGKVVYRADPPSHRAIPKDVAADVTFALQGVVKDGTGTAAQQLGRPVAGKTGTQGVGDKITSAWFTGYTKQIATSVMYVAGDGGTQDLDKYKRPWDATFFGSSYPAMTWTDYMESATRGQKVKEFSDPAYVNRDKYPPVAPRTTRPSNQQPEKPRDEQPSKEPTKSATQKASDKPTSTTTKRPPSSEPTDQPTDQPSDKPTDSKPTSNPTKSSKPPSGGETGGSSGSGDSGGGTSGGKGDNAGSGSGNDTGTSGDGSNTKQKSG